MHVFLYTRRLQERGYAFSGSSFEMKRKLRVREYIFETFSISISSLKFQKGWITTSLLHVFIHRCKFYRFAILFVTDPQFCLSSSHNSRSIFLPDMCTGNDQMIFFNVQMHVYVYVYMHIYPHTHLYMGMCMDLICTPPLKFSRGHAQRERERENERDGNSHPKTHAHTHMQIYVHVCIQINNIFVHVCTYVCTYMYIRMCVCVRACACACMYVRLCVCLCTCIFVLCVFVCSCVC